MDWNMYIVTADFGGGVKKQFEQAGLTAAGAHVMLVETYDYQVVVQRRGSPEKVVVELAEVCVEVEVER